MMLVSRLAVIAILFLSALFIQDTFGLSVSGNKIIDANGDSVILRGVDRCSFEWSPTGEMASLADYVLMKGWGANVVRLPMNQDFWLSGSTSYNEYYAANIQQQVDWIKSCGMYVILDLHWSDQGNLAGKAAQQCMADDNSITFWSQVAAAYKNDPSVLFELYNEPHDVSWSVWLNGGTGCDYNVVGMQQLYNAVRATGANNVVVVGGLNWAFDLSGVATYAVSGSNIAYATHPYDYAGKDPEAWDASFGYLAASYPVIATEFGQYCDNSSYVEELLAYCQSNGIHWTAWAWYVSGCSFPSIISDWTGTPFGIVGNAVYEALSGKVIAATVAPTVGPYAPASTNQAIYTDSLTNGWASYGWAADLTYYATAYVHSGSYSISFTPSDYGAVYVHQSAEFDWRVYQSFQFYIHGGSNSGQLLRAMVYDSTGSPVGNAINLPNPVVADDWVLQSIPITSFGIPSGTFISGFAIQGVPASVPIVYIDTITLETSATGSVATSPPSPTATPQPTNAATPAAASTSTQPTASALPTNPLSPTSVATSAPTSSPSSPPTSAPSSAPSTAPTSAPTLAPTAAAISTSSPSSSSATTPSSSSSSSSATTTVTIVMNGNTNSWWIGINSITGTLYEITSVRVMDSSPNAGWLTTNEETWGWDLSPPSQLVAPLTIQLISASYTATLSNIVTTLEGGSTVSASVTYS